MNDGFHTFFGGDPGWANDVDARRSWISVKREGPAYYDDVADLFERCGMYPAPWWFRLTHWRTR